MARDSRIGVSVGGLVPLTTNDYPGQLAATVFLQGCPWRCGYCHNPHLQPPDADGQQTWQSVLDFLDRRRGLLDAVVFSGGEPTAQPGLHQAVAQVRDMGYRIGLHTAGIYPRRLDPLLPLLDWVAIDIKAMPDDYAAITGCGPSSGEHAYDALRMVLGGSCNYEVRTTVHPAWLDETQTVTLGLELARLGVAHYALQEFRAPRDAVIPSSLIHSPITDACCSRLAPHFDTFTVRRA